MYLTVATYNILRLIAKSFMIHLAFLLKVFLVLKLVMNGVLLMFFPVQEFIILAISTVKLILIGGNQKKEDKRLHYTQTRSIIQTM